MNKQNYHLDLLAARHAQAVIRRTQCQDSDDPLSCCQEAGNVDNLVTKALGVLQENGVYAYTLYLLSRSQDKEKEISAIVISESLGLLEGLGFGWDQPEQPGNAFQVERVLEHISDKVVADNLEHLLLAKETLEQMLIYARYGVKARGAEEKEG